MVVVQGAVAELLAEVSCLTAVACFLSALLTRVMTWSEGMFVLSFPILAVSLVQGGLLRLLLLVVLVPRFPRHTGGLLDGHAAQLSLAELVHLATGLGHHDLSYGTPVGGETLD